MSRDVPLLELEDLTKKFGELTAVDGVSMEVHEEELTAIIGPNGAGKTTLYNLVSGLLPVTDGKILFDGEEVTSESVLRRVDRGLGRSFQIVNVFQNLTVKKNIRIPVIARSDNPHSVSTTIDSASAIGEETERMLELLDLEHLAEEPIKNLSYGQKRRIELGIALATEPKLLLLDEPTAGMTPSDSDDMTRMINRLDDETDVLFIVTEHDMDVIFSIANRIVVLHNGEVIADGTVEEIRTDPAVRSAYLGEER